MTKFRCIRNFKEMIKLICRVSVYLMMFSLVKIPWLIFVMMWDLVSYGIEIWSSNKTFYILWLFTRGIAAFQETHSKVSAPANKATCTATQGLPVYSRSRIQRRDWHFIYNCIFINSETFTNLLSYIWNFYLFLHTCNFRNIKIVKLLRKNFPLLNI